ncbi:MAG: hypothetical protein IT442_01690 [Phycisphaeraceae bacterium]|nr:hypothetical protein [Phycisphaeraceae bacterium]
MKTLLTHGRVQGNLLLVKLVAGAMGAPLIGGARAMVEREAGISRATLGWWVFALGLVGSAAGLVLPALLVNLRRTTAGRIGTVLLAVSCALLAIFRPEPGWVLAGLGAAWLINGASGPLIATANGVFADIWSHAPRTGVILLHAVNAGGKVLAPLALLAFSGDLRLTAMVFTAVMGLLAVEGWFWPRASVEAVAAVEKQHDHGRKSHWPTRALVWVIAVQFMLISGSEAGVVSILGPMVQQLRPSPIEGLTGGQWARWMIVAHLMGIFVGRIVLTLASGRLSERWIIGLCLATGLAALPAVMAESVWVYGVSLFVLGWAFSATWPAFYALGARAFPSEKTFLSLSAAFFSFVGASGGVAMSSVIGNTDARLPWAVVASTGVLALFAWFLWGTRSGRALGREEPCSSGGRGGGATGGVAWTPQAAESAQKG